MKIVDKMVEDFDRKCEDEGHTWVITHLNGTYYCRGCGKTKKQPIERWQPIDTAPKDGTDILIAGDYAYATGVLMAAWCKAADAFVDMERDRYTPTHWMPMPLPPEETL